MTLPLGADFEWKLAVRDDGGAIARWEQGDNHSSRAAPPPLAPDGVLGLSGAWR